MFSLDCFDWLLLPKPTKNHKVISTLVRNYFQGYPSVKTLTKVPEFLLHNDDEELSKSIEGDMIPCEIKEEDRLSAVVDLITNDSIIIPRGSWIKLPSGDVARNLTFTGLNFTECTKLESYLHKRIPQQKSNVSLTKRQDYNYALDFLDPIDMDLPKGDFIYYYLKKNRYLINFLNLFTECWSLQPYFKDNLIIIRNLYWPGMTFYHKLNSSEYGSIYIGDGIKNKNLPFMI